MILLLSTENVWLRSGDLALTSLLEIVLVLSTFRCGRIFFLFFSVFSDYFKFFVDFIAVFFVLRCSSVLFLF